MPHSLNCRAYVRAAIICVLTIAILGGCGGKHSALTPAGSSASGKQHPAPPRFTAGQPQVGLALKSPHAGGLVQVTVRPQAPSNPPAKIASAITVLPSLLPKPSTLGKRASDTATLRTLQASSYDTALPLNRVNANFASAVFNPSFAGGGTTKQIAYACYRFSASGYSGTPTLGLTWDPTAAPDNYDNYWVAVANQSQDRWDWFQGPIDGVITLPALTQYKAGNGDMLVIVALLGSKTCTLTGVALGPPEVRGTGNDGLTSGGAPGSDAPPLFGGTLPAKVDLSGQCAPIRNQGQLGSCTAFAIGSGVMNYEMHRLYVNKGWDFSNDNEELAPRYLYLETGKDEGLPCSEQGRYYDKVVSWIKAHGICLEHNAPYLPSPCEPSYGANAAGDAAVVKPVRAEAVPCTTDAGILQLKTLLAQGHLCPVGTLLDQGFMNWTAGDAPWSFTGPADGGHAMCIVGYDDAKQAFKVRNSWGIEWGENGYVWIAYNSLKNPEANAMAFVIECEYSQAVVDRFFGGGGNSFNPPGGVSASDGTSTSKIILSWSPVAGATGYKLYRDVQDVPIQVLGNVITFDDTTATGGYSHTYWVKAVKGATESDFSASDTGYLKDGGGGQAPVIYGVTYDPGSVGDSCTFHVDYYSAEAPTFSWTLNGCNPGSSTQESPTVTFSTAGTQLISVTVTNSSGSTPFSGNIEIGGGGTAPTASLTGSPLSGTAPLHVLLDASASTDDTGIYEFLWDWEGDGTFDYNSGVYSAIYVDYPAGTWNTTVRVVDLDGFTSDDNVSISVTGGSQGSYTEIEPNDVFAQSSAIHFATGDLGSLGSGTGYPGYDGGIDDVWGVNVLSPLTLQVQCDTNIGTGDLDLYLYDSVGNLGAWSETNNATEYIEVPIPNPGIYYIVVHDYAGFSDYQLSYGSF